MIGVLACKTDQPPSNLEQVPFAPAAVDLRVGVHAEVIDLGLVQRWPHLSQYTGHILLGNSVIQVVLKGADINGVTNQWMPLVAAVYIGRTDQSWVRDDLLYELLLGKKDLSSSSLAIESVIPSVDLRSLVAYVDVVYRDTSKPQAPSTEFVRFFLNSEDPSFYLMTDHMAFRRSRPNGNGRTILKQRSKAGAMLPQDPKTGTEPASAADKSGTEYVSFGTGKHGAVLTASDRFEAHIAESADIAWTELQIATSGRAQKAFEFFMWSWDPDIYHSPETVSEALVACARDTAGQRTEEHVMVTLIGLQNCFKLRPKPSN